MRILISTVAAIAAMTLAPPAHSDPCPDGSEVQSGSPCPNDVPAWLQERGAVVVNTPSEGGGDQQLQEHGPVTWNSGAPSAGGGGGDVPAWLQERGAVVVNTPSEGGGDQQLQEHGPVMANPSPCNGIATDCVP